jgi:hypothetical protein
VDNPAAAGNTRLMINNTKTADYKESYANNAEVVITRWDVLIRLGVFSKPPNGGDRDWAVESFQGVYMSPVHAKEFHRYLGEHLKAYEAAWGEINNELQPAQRDAMLESLSFHGEKPV